MEPTEREVGLSVEDGVATVRLHREHGNAVNGRLVDGLLSAIQEAEADPGVHGVLLAAKGKLFCPGIDLIEAVEYDRDAMRSFMERFTTCLLSLYTFSKPMVAAISGHALAGGCVLVLAADWRVLKRGALMGLNEIKVGVPLPFGVASILSEAVRSSRLQEVALLGRNYSDEEAVAAGLAHEIHGAEGLEEHCLLRLGEFASRDLAAFAITKRYLRAGTVERIRASDRLCLDEFLDCWFSATTRRSLETLAEALRTGRDRTA